MKNDRIRCLISGLRRFELTEAESQFVYLAEQKLNKNGSLAESIEPILEWIYSQKTEFIRDSVFSMLNQQQEGRFS